ncbi:MAG: ABC transporter ATP-binding protein [Bacilli bacterium]|nr:ABC transporter ATP-binding protein [Bacilli bacterium]
MINVLGLTKIYHSNDDDSPDIKALDHVSFGLKDKGMVFVLGESGSGKSTLLNLLGGLDNIDSGDIVVNGVSLSSLKGRSLDSFRNGCVGFVFQEFNLLENKTVKDNVSLALNLQCKRNKKAVDEVLSKVSMAALSKRKASTLSGGEKQRVAIARALVKEPTLLLCDEPTGALDSDTGAKILELLKEISSTKLVVVVSHDESFAEKYGDRIIKIEDGKIISDTDPIKTRAQEGSLTIAKSRMGLKDVISLAAHSFKAKISRLAMTVVLSAVSFAAFGIASAYSSWDADEAALDSIIGYEEHRSVAITCYDDEGPAFISKRRIEALKREFERKVFIKECMGVDVYGNEVEYLSDVDKGQTNANLPPSDSGSNNFYLGDIFGYMHFSQDEIYQSGFTLRGRLPEKDDEIVIPTYYMNRLGLRTYSDVKARLDIGELLGRNYRIVGELFTNFNSNLYAVSERKPIDKQNERLLDCVYDELRNSFSGNIIVNDSLSEYLTSKDARPIAVSNGYDVFDVAYDTVKCSLEELYAEFIAEKERQYYLAYPQYYIYDLETGEVQFKGEWYDVNGYTYDPSNGKYTKTISGPDGDYTVIYDLAGERKSEEEDPDLVFPEKAPINLTRREFVDQQFLFSNQSGKNALLIDDDTFAPLGEEEAIIIADDENSPICVDYLAGNSDVVLAADGDETATKIKGICIKRDKSNENFANLYFTNSSLLVSSKIKDFLEERVTGSYRLIAKLPNNQR